jgi:hypothetical protein
LVANDFKEVKMRKGLYLGIIGIGFGSALWMRAYLGLFGGGVQITLGITQGIIYSVIAVVCLALGLYGVLKSTGVIPEKPTKTAPKRG